MQKGEWHKRASEHREITGSGFMCPCFRELVMKKIPELIDMEVEYGLMTQDGAAELVNDISSICGIDPVIELRRILIAELYAYATELSIEDHWYELYRDDLEREQEEQI